MPKSPSFAQPPLGKTIPVTFQSPKATELFTDDVLNVTKDPSTPKYVEGKKGDPHPDKDRYPDHELQVVVPSHDGASAIWTYTRIRPPLISYDSTPEGQIDTITKSRVKATDDPPELSALRVGARQENLADGDAQLTITDEPAVFGAAEFSVEIPDLIPQEFRDLVPITTSAKTEAGKAHPPVLGPGEVAKSSRQVTKYRRRQSVTGRDTEDLPRTLVDKELSGINAHGSTFGGAFDIVKTLDKIDQPLEEGFGITESRVKQLGGGLTSRETERLSVLQGASLLLTDPGDDFSDDPLVVFEGGTFGTGAAGTAVLSINPGGDPGDPGQPGVFNFNHITDGDRNGLIYFLGAHYNGGTFTNPRVSGQLRIVWHTSPTYPLSNADVDRLVDRDPLNTSVIMVPDAGGSHYWFLDIGEGRKLKANFITFRAGNTTEGQMMRDVRVEGANDFVTPYELGEVHLNNTAMGWAHGDLNDSVGFRYFRIYGLDGPIPGLFPDFWPPLILGEIEIYGELTQAPEDPGNPPPGVVENSVTGVVMTDGGHDYVSAPRVVFVGVGTGAAGTAVLKDGKVDHVDMTDGGKDYLVAPEVHFIGTGGGNGATAGAVLDGAVIDVQVEDGGGLFATPPAISFGFETGGTGAAADAFLGFILDHIDVTDGGSLFTVEPNVVITPDNGASAHAVLTGDVVTSIVIDSPGEDFEEPPLITLEGDGIDATAVGFLAPTGRIIRIVPSAGGSLYQSAPDVGIFPDNGAVAIAFIEGPIDHYVVTDGGEDYDEAPLLQVAGDGGATATTQISAEGVVTGIVPGVPGLYDQAPLVNIVPAGFPVGQAIIGFPVDDIVVDDSGGLFSIPPPVQVNGDGSGVSAVSVLGFPLDRVLITAGGNYATTPTPHFTGDGIAAVGTAVRGFAVASTTVTPGAFTYLVAPDVVVSGGGSLGMGAAFVALIGRPLATLTLANVGEGFTSDPAVAITGDGTGAAAHSVRSFKLASITATTGGTLYTAATIVIDPPTGENGVQATAHAVIVGGVITDWVLDNPGFGYLTAPAGTITGDGSGATADPVLAAAGIVDSLVLDTVGANYTEVFVAVTGGGGTIPATATVTLDLTVAGPVKKLVTLYPGQFYTSAPTLTMTGGATATATLATTGTVVSVTLSNHGRMFTQNAVVFFTGGGGTGGGAGIGLLSTVGAVKSVTLIKGGKDFSVTPTIKIPGGDGDAQAHAVLSNRGSIKTLTLLQPGPDYNVPPLVSFIPGDKGAAALYILPTGWPVLTDIIVDPTEGIVVNVIKKIVPKGSPRPAGYTDIYALDKWRSIQITSKIDVDALALLAPEEFAQTHVLNLPGQLISVRPTYSSDRSVSAGIDTRFGSTSVKCSVRGKIVAHILDGYRGPAKARVVRRFMMGAPTLEETPAPFIITPATGTAYITSRHFAESSSVGVRGGFGYAEKSFDSSENVESLDISGVLTGDYGLAGSSTPIVVSSGAISSEAQYLANASWMMIDPTRLNLAQNSVTAYANFVVDIPASCPSSLPANFPFLLSAVVEKWRFGLYVQTLTYVTTPPDSCAAGDPGGGSST